MNPHEQRVIVEQTELQDKINKLLAFTGTDVFRAIDKAEQDRLTEQLTYMTSYNGVLLQRIAAF